MDDHPLEVEGAWIRICGRLFWTGGTASKTLDQWARILRENHKKTQKILQYLSANGIADLVNQNGSITITSRRIVRDEYIRQIRKEAGSKGGNPRLKNDTNLVNQNNNQSEEQNPTLSVSVSASELLLTNVSNLSPDKSGCPHKKIIELYHSNLPMCPEVVKWTDARAANLRARWNENKEQGTLEWWEWLFKEIAKSKWLTGRVTGRNGRGFFASLDWIVKPENLAKILEGKYHDQ